MTDNTKEEIQSGNFELEYELQLFREVQDQYFDSYGNSYNATGFGSPMCEKMLSLINNLESELSRLKEENERLKEWKESALKVMPDFQEIGKLLNIPLRTSVSEQIIPAIKKLLQTKQS